MSLRFQDVAEIESLDLRLYIMNQHLGGQPVDQVRRVLIDPVGKIVRADRERCHVRTERQHPSAFLARAGPPTGRELDDHAGAVLF
jgi:hypothetical protein